MHTLSNENAIELKTFIIMLHMIFVLGSFYKAETCEIVDTFLLSKMVYEFDKEYIKLYCDDGL